MTEPKEDPESESETSKDIPGGFVGAFAGSAALLLLLAAVPIIGVGTLFFPPLLVIVVAAFLLVALSGPYLAIRGWKRNRLVILKSLLATSALAALCTEYNASPATFAGGSLLIFPLTFVVFHFFKDVRFR
jgi:glucose-6-phosphate-specific signal transduction histidine kinase